MPIYRYTPVNAPCRLCGDGFDHCARPGEVDLTACPTCGQPVARVAVQPVHALKILKPLSVTEAKGLGFQVFKKTSGGELERQ